MTEKMFINRRGQRLEGLKGEKEILNNGVTVGKEYLNVVQQTPKTTRGFFFYPSQVYCFSFANNCNEVIAHRIIRGITQSNTKY